MSMDDLVSGSRFHFGLIGWPLGHSLSPAIHSAALASCDLRGEYTLCPTPPLPGGAQVLDRLVQRLRRRELHGMNVTIPHKRSILPYLDRLTAMAKDIGAVNLVYLEDGLLVGDNSDAPAFMTDMQHVISLKSHAGTALVLGAGGAARAAVCALLQAEWVVYLVARRIEAARQLVSEMAYQAVSATQKLAPLSLDVDAIEVLSGCELVVNATPVGMFPRIDESPWPEELPLPSQAAVYDMVYNPTETVLVRAARAEGRVAANGLGMLVEQAALSFERWTGLPAPRDIMWKAALASLLPAQVQDIDSSE
jgi:shikimate dehydrogenase